MNTYAQSLRLMYHDDEAVKHIDAIKKMCVSAAPKQQKINYMIVRPSHTQMNQNEFDTLIRNIIYYLERQLALIVDQEGHEGSTKLTISWMRYS
jgi:hypothetical protein